MLVLWSIKQTYLTGYLEYGYEIHPALGQDKKRLISCSGNRKGDQPFPVNSVQYSFSKGKALL